MSSKRNLAGAWLVVLAVLCCAGGCAAPGDSQPAPIAVQKNIETWSGPLDSYIYSDMEVELYAQQLLIENCLEEHGVAKHPMYTMQVTGPRPANQSPSGYRFPSLSNAEQHGYGGPADTRLADQSAPAGYQQYLSSLTGNAGQQANQCYQDSEKELGSDGKGVQYAAGLMAAVNPDKDPAVQRAAATWRTCMAPLGVPDLPEGGPMSMPSPSQAKSFGHRDGVDSIPTPAATTAAEIKAATFDLTCQESSGYLKAFYDAYWNEQVKQLNQHYKELEAAKPAVDAYRQHILDIIAKYGGT